MYTGKKKLIILTLMLLCASFAMSTRPASAAHAMSGAAVRVVLNKKTLHMSPDPMLVDSRPYLPLRVVCEALSGQVWWDKEKNQAVISYKGRSTAMSGIIRENCLMVGLEEIATVFGVNASYDPGLSAVTLDHGEAPSRQQLLTLLPRYDTYDNEDLYWLSRIVEAEAMGEPYESKLAVASVIINRLNNDAYPNTIKEVIFDKKHGVQFTPTANGTVYNDPSIQSYLAALDALEGRNNALGALFFMNPEYATSFWMQKNRQYAFTIGGHSYYY